VFLMKQLRKIYMCREDSIFNTSCDLWIVITSFEMLSAVRHADSSVKIRMRLAASSAPVAVKRRTVNSLSD
jgi:hypothetical protein